VNVSKKTASLNPTQSHYDSFEYFLDNLTIFWISEVMLRSARCVTVRAFAAACHVVAHGAKMQRLRLCDMLCVDDEYAALRDQYQTQVGSPEQRLARWVIYAVLAAPAIATLLHDLGVGGNVKYFSPSSSTRAGSTRSLECRQRILLHLVTH
jgi:hypothetical protein